MRKTGHSRVVGLVGVGFDAEEGQIRITRAEPYHVVMGSDETHSELRKICFRIDQAVKESGRTLNSYTPEEFMDLMKELY